MGDLSFKPLDQFDIQARSDFADVGPVDVFESNQVSRKAALFAVMNGEKRIGSILFRHDESENFGKELVVNAVFVEDLETHLMEGWALIVRMAQANGFIRIRLNTQRPGLVRQLIEIGAEASIAFAVPPVGGNHGR